MAAGGKGTTLPAPGPPRRRLRPRAIWVAWTEPSAPWPGEREARMRGVVGGLAPGKPPKPHPAPPRLCAGTGRESGHPARGVARGRKVTGSARKPTYRGFRPPAIPRESVGAAGRRDVRRGGRPCRSIRPARIRRDWIGRSSSPRSSGTVTSRTGGRPRARRNAWILSAAARVSSDATRWVTSASRAPPIPSLKGTIRNGRRRCRVSQARSWVRRLRYDSIRSPSGLGCRRR